MTDTHYELMSTLQSQRDQLAQFVWIFAPPEYATLRTEAVDLLDMVHRVIQLSVSNPHSITAPTYLEVFTCANTALIERLNTALVAMPQPAYEAAEGGL